MKTLLAGGTVFVLFLFSTVVWATPGELDNIHPRGDLAPEQIRRLEADSSEIIYAPKTPLSDEEYDLLDELHRAKLLGDLNAVAQLEKSLAQLHGKSMASAGSDGEKNLLEVIYADDVQAPDGEKWLPHEYLLAGSEENEFKPEIVADSDGTLYAAYVQEDAGIGFVTTISISHDGGEHWSWRYKLLYTSDDTPSMVICEGNENYLFVSVQPTARNAIRMFRMNLDDYEDVSYPTIYTYYDDMVTNARLATDSDEYSVWYVYLVFNAMAVDNWVFLTSRTTDLGETWAEPEITGGYCGYPDLFYDAHQAHPDIAYGSGRVYLAFDNYPSPCTTSERDIFVLMSENWGFSYGDAVQLTTSGDDEHDPAVGAFKNFTDMRTAVVAWTRYWGEMDDDIWRMSTQDGGETWAGSGCIACTTLEERNINLATSPALGMVYAAFWDENNVNYGQAEFNAPHLWTRIDSLSTSDTALDINARPGLLVDPTKPDGQQAGIAWTDIRHESSAGLDIYYDAAVLPEPPDDYFLYNTFNPGVGPLCGIDGFVDHEGQIEGLPGAEYLVFTGGAVYSGDITGYIFRVETDGDPQTHPDNPENTGPVAPRIYTFVSSHYMGWYGSAHDNAFYVDETGIYYGGSDNGYGDDPGWTTFMGGAIWRWDFDWNLLECVVTPAAAGGQTLSRNDATGHWWYGTGNRRLYKWDGATWEYIFTAPHLGGSHHDGLVVIENSLYVSDMTSDAIQQYRLDDDGNLMDDPYIPFKTFYYTASAHVEGMGFGPNDHIWITGGGAGLYEIGGGSLQVALNGIPNQCSIPGDGFEPFDLDDYVVGDAPFSWSFSGNVDLEVVIDAANIVSVAYPPGWMGQETITFTVVDGLGRTASDSAAFTVSPVPVVGDIPDQTAPFSPFDLDNYLLAGVPELITWTASGMDCLNVHIDPVTNIVTVEFPEGCSGPEAITFRAFIEPCDGSMSDEDVAVFDLGLSGVTGPVATAFALGHPAPNPCVSSTQVSYSVPAGSDASEVSLAVYDLAGRRIRNLVGSETGVVQWNCRNDQGQPVPSGVYFIQLRWNQKHISERVLLIR
jgi:hypothetical protein